MGKVSLLSCLLWAWSLSGAADVLVVADEIPAMEYFGERLRAEESLSSQVVTQGALPADLAPFRAVIVYIHGKLGEPTENALVDYTKAGGKLIALHHSISSGKRQNQQWFRFLGVSLAEGEVSQGGYKWIEPITLDVVSLAPDHFITTNKLTYPARIPYRRSDAAGAAEPLPGFTLHDSEVYLNHTFTEPRTVLLGFRYTDAKSGQVYMQDRAGWVRPAGRGMIIYLLPGHSVKDFQDPTYARLVMNAVVYSGR